MKADEADKLLVESVESLQEYFTEHEIACAKLKQGFLKLTKAKLRLPEHALSEISYHEEFEASRVVALDSEGKWHLRDAAEAFDGKSDGSSLHHRRAGKNKEEEGPVNATGISARPSADTLLWFSSLPPSDLRQAQKQFASGLQALLVAAASAKKVQRSVDGVKGV
ncbi:hypothetical protein PF005_g10506 [Phytophthora fragariae]|uniref:Vacuolar ATPase assembly protein VMA22 n=2 Tax=Phytophthora TaxID=4783 RepID=A0A6A3F463_9STRA|nr:hypothetical protein PF003_g19603 [Phytophthora fragariae]KAE9045721.1 hypothetical protein PR002_g2058 [Phytophthora rubi]KAE8938540.1 hypothetical protein PF009_g11592 [Phytophthora fragariae]KAE9011646.1 hypothetical protein PF011_g9281 [Phytophthora fragariae]KAE9050838.1 hypothetical protein PR001_g2017 [Phytophthora rubi]